MAFRGVLRTILPRLGLAVAGVAAGIAIAEVALRILGWSQDLDYRLYLRELKNSRSIPLEIWADPESGDLAVSLERARKRYPPFQPGAVELATTSDYSVIYRVNSRGLRDGEHAFERPSGGSRFVALGDSFTFGAGVSFGQRFTEVAERRLADVEIVNMGVPGYGLDDALLAFIAEGHRYRPDGVLVILNGHLVNRHKTGIYADGVVRVPIDLGSVQTGNAGDPETLYLASSDPFFRQSPWIVRSSYFLAYATYQWQVWRLRARLREDDARFWKDALRRRRPTHVTEDRSPYRRARTIALLETLRDRSTAGGAQLIVVNIDDKCRYDYVARIPGVAYHDLSGPLHRRGQAQNLRFRVDRHYNADTHAFIGRRLAEILSTEIDARRSGLKGGSRADPRPFSRRCADPLSIQVVQTAAIERGH